MHDSPLSRTPADAASAQSAGAGAGAGGRSEPLLRVEGLTVALPAGSDRPFAIREVSFDLHPDEILCIVGESGSGKSISANAIMGLLPHYLRPKAGRILFRDRDLLALDETQLLALRGREIGMIFQEPMSALNPLMRVGDQIAEVMAVHGAYPGAARHRRVLELLSLVGLPDPQSLQHAYPFRLSGGQRQRVMIAMALACRPRLLIADEPTTALDVTIQAQILDLLDSLRKQEDMGLILITHDLGVVAEHARATAVMYAGSLMEHAATADLFCEPLHPYTELLLASLPQQGRPGEPLQVIPGSLPTPGEVVTGCPFAPRCPRQAPECLIELPELRELRPGHQVRCVRCS